MKIFESNIALVMAEKGVYLNDEKRGEVFFSEYKTKSHGPSGYIWADEPKLEDVVKSAALGALSKDWKSFIMPKAYVVAPHDITCAEEYYVKDTLVKIGAKTVVFGDMLVLLFGHFDGELKEGAFVHVTKRSYIVANIEGKRVDIKVNPRLSGDDPLASEYDVAFVEDSGFDITKVKAKDTITDELLNIQLKGMRHYTKVFNAQTGF